MSRRPEDATGEDQTSTEDGTDAGPASSAASEGATASRGPAFPTVMVNAAEQDPDPSETSSDSTAPRMSADYDNDREDLPPGPTHAP